jgi:hypothetical protein
LIVAKVNNNLSCVFYMSITMLSVVKLSVIMLSVVVPFCRPQGLATLKVNSLENID